MRRKKHSYLPVSRLLGRVLTRWVSEVFRSAQVAYEYGQSTARLTHRVLLVGVWLVDKQFRNRCLYRRLVHLARNLKKKFVFRAFVKKHYTVGTLLRACFSLLTDSVCSPNPNNVNDRQALASYYRYFYTVCVFYSHH